MVEKIHRLYYRQKILLALLQEFGGELDSTNFQKYLFLITKNQKIPSYDFIPYKYGCFSFQSSIDKYNLCMNNYLSDTKNWKINYTKENYIKTLLPEDQTAIASIMKEYSKIRGKNLIKLIYKTYPYYALNSNILNNILTQNEIQKIKESINFKDNCLFTIGYENKSIEAYLNQLIKNGITLLCDVRKNPISRKYGFSKTQLSELAKKVKISYIHFPELGIDSECRKNLQSEEDYKTLFKYYRTEIIPNQESKLRQIQSLMSKHKRIAITCFELCSNQCHRSHLANALKTLPSWQYPIIDL